MRLSEFIRAKREEILVEWEEFARTCTPACSTLDVPGLRDHASEMLTVIATDLETPQGGHEQAEKSKGNAPAEAGKTAAERHGADRAESGFTTEQMVSEYRALRASVIRLWTKSEGGITSEDLEDLTRFHEAIDQALAESIVRYTQDLDNSKEMFLAILGHDLRTPIGAVMMSAEFMLETGELAEPHLELATRISRAAKRMNHMVGALLDFTRSRLGGGIPIVREKMDLAHTVREVSEEIAAAYPDRTLQIGASGEVDGEWDCPRISQVLTNLMANAMEHGSAGTDVTVAVQGDENEVDISIHNRGPAIPTAQMQGLFNPMKNSDGMDGASTGASGNLGLGLYIAERIVNAHRGRITVKSSEEDGTTFTVHLPRSA
ncbi:MAG: ATP-binding protein [Gemmatimonadaceae bacterium]